MILFKVSVSIFALLIAAVGHWSCSRQDDLTIAGSTGSFSREHDGPTERPTGPLVHWTTLGEGAHQERLGDGFYEPDSPSWRWTKPAFHLYLDPIPSAEKNYLALDFALPDHFVKEVGIVRLTAFVQGEQIAAEEYTRGGRFEFSTEVPKELIRDKWHVGVNFAIDKTFGGSREGRSLGLIAHAAGFRDYHLTTDLRGRHLRQARLAYEDLTTRYADKLANADREKLQRLFHDFDVWRSMWFQGVEIIKNPLDLWMVQQIIYEIQPDFVIETGTFRGGSALFWAHTLHGMGLEDSRVLTVDLYHHLDQAPRNPLWDQYVRFYLGSSTDPKIVEQVADLVHGKKTLIFLDSDHRMHHVLRELELYAPLVSPGSYIVVEDTHIDALNTQPAVGPGPMAAVEEFLRSEAGAEFERDISREAFVLTFNPGGWLRRNPG